MTCAACIPRALIRMVCTSMLWLFAALATNGVGARAEQLIATLSHDRVFITSNFTGAELALFGSIERDAASVAVAGDYDLIVTVQGPRGVVTVREKRALGPLWLNLDQRKYIATPSFIATLSNQPLKLIASPDQLQKLLIGIDPLVPGQAASDKPDDPEFRDALIRLRRKEGLYRDDAKGVTMLKADLFKAAIRIPGTAPLGTYDVTVNVFASGAPLARTTLKFAVIKSGFEQTIATYAQENALAYGLAVCLMALFSGWLASIIFRRD